MIRPTRNKKINSKYGMRKHPIDKKIKMHQGQDYIPSIKGAAEDILAALGGNVKVSRWQYNHKGFGKHIILEHNVNGKVICTLYCHLKDLLVKPGQTIAEGQKIATMGTTGASTGVHLHFGVFECSFKNFYKKGIHGFKYPVDPEKYFKVEKEIEKPSEIPEWGRKAWENAIKTGLLDGSNPNGPMTRLMYAQAEYNKTMRG